MLFCDSVWCLPEEKLDDELQDIHQVLLQTSPQLIKVLHGYALLDEWPGLFISLFDIRLVLDHSWDELRTIICPLRGITGENTAALKKLFTYASHPTRIRELHPDPTLWDLANGSMRLMKKITVHRVLSMFE